MPSPSPRIGIVVTDAYSAEDPDHDTPVLLAALQARGVAAESVVWHDPTIDPAAFDLLVIRSPWDYPERPREFLDWLDRAETATHIVNTPATVRWNLDKRYLGELEHGGIRVVPTVYAETTDAAARAIATHNAPGARLVVKPAMSAGARDTGLFAASDPRALELAERIIGGGGVAMIQPEIAELTEGQEKALYVIGGTFTHAIAKGALLEAGGGLRGGVYAENPVLVEASPAKRRFGEEVLRAVAAASAEETPLYARIDIVDSAAFGRCVLEVELIEPALNLHIAPHATPAVVDAILGAASHAVASGAER